MAEIISAADISDLTKKRNHKTLVLVGGCFDLLHPGHIIFLQKAKQMGDLLVVLLESDTKVKKLKGLSRPIYHQSERAQILAALRAVDYVVKLPDFENQDYDLLISQIKPDVIAVTAGSENTHHQRVAQKTGAQLKIATKLIKPYSSSYILKQFCSLDG